MLHNGKCVAGNNHAHKEGLAPIGACLGVLVGVSESRRTLRSLLLPLNSTTFYQPLGSFLVTTRMSPKEKDSSIGSEAGYDPVALTNITAQTVDERQERETSEIPRDSPEGDEVGEKFWFQGKVWRRGGQALGRPGVLRRPPGLGMRVTEMQAWVRPWEVPGWPPDTVE